MTSGAQRGARPLPKIPNCKFLGAGFKAPVEVYFVVCVILFLACSSRIIESSRVMDLERLKAGHRGVITKLTRELNEALTRGPATGEKVGRLNVVYEQL